MDTIAQMGRKKLGRVTRNITLSPGLAEQAEAVAESESRPLSHLIEEVLRTYIAEKINAGLRLQAPRKPGPRPGKKR